CDKPLGVNSREGRAMLTGVERAGVKHAYGATSRYSPAILYARQLLTDGLIGNISQIESSAHEDWSSMPYHWFHQISQGGGYINTIFTHKLAQVIYLTGSRPQAVTGWAHPWVGQVRYADWFHDSYDLSKPHPSPQEDSSTWREVDADSGCTIALQLRMPAGQIA